LCSAGVCWSMKSSMKGNEKKSSEASGAESPDAAQNTILCLAASPVMMSLVLSASPTLIVRWACVCCFNLQIQGVSCLMSRGGGGRKQSAGLAFLNCPQGRDSARRAAGTRAQCWSPTARCREYRV
jgi:hypothetical protein